MMRPTQVLPGTVAIHTEEPGPFDVDDYLLLLVNDVRVPNGLPPLPEEEALDQELHDRAMQLLAAGGIDLAPLGPGLLTLPIFALERLSDELLVELGLSDYEVLRLRDACSAHFETIAQVFESAHITADEVRQLQDEYTAARRQAHAETGLPATGKRTRGRPGDAIDQRILGALPGRQVDLQAALGIAKTTLRNRLRALERRGLVVMDISGPRARGGSAGRGVVWRRA